MKPNLGNAGKLVRTTAGTYGWLGPIYDAMDAAFRVMTPSGASGIPNAVWFAKDVPRAQVGAATGAVGLYGFTGINRIATGGAGLLTATYLGASGFAATGAGNSGLANFLGRAAFGSTGTLYTLNDVVDQLKNQGSLPL